MSGTIKTDTALLAGFPSNGVGAITAQQTRDLTVSKINVRQVRNQQTINYTLQASDYTACVDMNASSPVTVTVPQNVFSVGDYVDIQQLGTGGVQIIPGSGVTVNSEATLFISRQYGKIRLEQVSSNVWTMNGDVQPLPTKVTARIDDFLATLGTSLHVSQGLAAYTNASTLLTDLKYVGMRLCRDNTTTTTAYFDVYQSIVTAGAGIKMIFIVGLASNLVVANELAALKNLIGQLSTGAVKAIEQLNEPNLVGGWIYNGVTMTLSGTPGFGPVAQFSAAMYQALKSDGVTSTIPVATITVGGADPVDNGLQLLAIPTGYQHCTPLVTASATTAIGNATLHFTSTTTSPVLTNGLYVYDDVNHFIPSGATISSFTSTAIVLSATVTGVIAIGSTIRIGACQPDTTIFGDLINIHPYPLASSEAVFNNALGVNPTDPAGNTFDSAISQNFVTQYNSGAKSGLNLGQVQALPKIITECGFRTDQIRITTSATTTNGGTVLTFSNSLGTIVPPISYFVGVYGCPCDISHPGSITTGTSIVSASTITNTLTLSAGVNGTIPIGETIQLAPYSFGWAAPASVIAKSILSGWFQAWRQAYQAYIVYAMYDETAIDFGSYGIFTTPGNPKTAATYLHNLTTVLQDPGQTKSTFSTGALQCLVSNLPATSGQAAYFQRSDGVFIVAIWNEVSNWDDTLNPPAAVSITPTNVTVSFAREGTINVYDPTLGTSAQQTLTNNSVVVSLVDYPQIITFQ